jgi:DNA gyrase subunit A
LIRGAPDAVAAREQLMARAWPARDVGPLVALIADPRHKVDEGNTVRLSEEQAKAILELRLQRLTGLGRDEINDEAQKLGLAIADYLEILSSRERVLTIIRDELAAIRDEFATPRKTELIDAETEMEDEALIEREEVAVTVTHAGYIKRTPLAEYRVQGRGGKGRSGMATRDEDFVTSLFVASTHAWLLFFSSTGNGQPAAAGGRRAHHHHPGAAGKRYRVGQAERGVRHQVRRRAAQPAVRLCPGQQERQDRHEAG